MRRIADINQVWEEPPLISSEHRLILASRVINIPVFNKSGERVGHVDDLSIERVTGKTIYAIVSFGGFLGIGERFHPLP